MISVKIHKEWHQFHLDISIRTGDIGCNVLNSGIPGIGEKFVSVPISPVLIEISK
jgi:hypothetical protein